MRSISAPSGIPRETFVQWLKESGLFSGDDLGKTLDVLASDPNYSDGAALARHLIDSGRLTPYQAEAVLRHRLDELQFGSYLVLDRLGAGGMGTVYKACHGRMKRIVALKVLAREAAGQGTFAHRFQREVETIAQLSHPNIVMAFDAGEAAAGLFLVMEFVNGRDLDSEVQEHGPLSVADAVSCLLQAAHGLAYAHGQGVIHRDVKPANLLRDASGLVKVADLGLARLSSGPAGGSRAGLTQAGGIVGTADYMAPEQALDSTTIDARADVYALGCTLYYLLTGQTPYRAGSIIELLFKHRDAPIPTLGALRPDVPVEVEALFRRMVAKRPEDRLATMLAVVEALEGLQDKVADLRARPVVQPKVPALSSLTGETVAVDTVEQLPAKAQRPETATQDRAASQTVGGGRAETPRSIVLVEPSRTQAAIVRKYLHDLGIDQVHSTGSGREALALAKQQKADVLLSALHLTDMTGVQLVQALRAEAGCANVGFVLASSESPSGEALAILAMPRTILLPKPFDLRQLEQALARAAGRSTEGVPGGQK
jgi:serine/threonine-protein kinase